MVKRGGYAPLWLRNSLYQHQSSKSLTKHIMPTKQKLPKIQQIVITIERNGVSRTLGLEIITDKPGTEISAMPVLDIILDAAKMVSEAALQS